MNNAEDERSQRARNVGVVVFAGLSALVFAARVVADVVLGSLDQHDEFIFFVSIVGLLVSLVGLVVLLMKLRR